MKPEKKESTDPFEQFQPGDYVKHVKFGEGQILQKTGSGKDTKFVVSFSEEGEKRLMAAFVMIIMTSRMRTSLLAADLIAGAIILKPYWFLNDERKRHEENTSICIHYLFCRGDNRLFGRTGC